VNNPRPVAWGLTRVRLDVAHVLYLRPVLDYPVDQVGLALRMLAYHPMDQKPGGLIDRQKIFVFVEYFEIHLV
jgi:hypothetical protein